MNGESKLGNIASAFTLRGMLKTEQYCPALTLSVHTAKYEHCLVTKQGGSVFCILLTNVTAAQHGLDSPASSAAGGADNTRNTRNTRDTPDTRDI